MNEQNKPAVQPATPLIQRVENLELFTVDLKNNQEGLAKAIRAELDTLEAAVVKVPSSVVELIQPKINVLSDSLLLLDNEVKTEKDNTAIIVTDVNTLKSTLGSIHEGLSATQLDLGNLTGLVKSNGNNVAVIYNDLTNSIKSNTDTVTGLNESFKTSIAEMKTANAAEFTKMSDGFKQVIDALMATIAAHQETINVLKSTSVSQAEEIKTVKEAIGISTAVVEPVNVSVVKTINVVTSELMLDKDKVYTYAEVLAAAALLKKEKLTDGKVNLVLSDTLVVSDFTLNNTTLSVLPYNSVIEFNILTTDDVMAASLTGINPIVAVIQNKTSTSNALDIFNKVS